jgi:hypothetical protein
MVAAAHDVDPVRAAAGEPTGSRRWSASAGEFFLVGGATPFLFAISWWVRKTFGLDGPEYAIGFLTFHAAFVINDPHFAVTYLLFYRDGLKRAFGKESDAMPRGRRVRYLVAGVAVPVVLAVWSIGAIATKSAVALGLMIQLMFFTVGWHYVKQGFGVLVVLAARRGARFDRRERFVLLAHAFAGWAYAWASPADPGTEVEEKGVVYTSLAHGPWLERVTHGVFLVTALLLVVALVQKVRREGRLPLVTPLTAFLCSIWSWSIYSSVDPLVVYVIPALHSVQYLYFVALLRGNEAREREGPPWFEPSARVRLGTLAVSAVGLGWLLFHGAPAALDDLVVPHGDHGRVLPSVLGPTPYFAAIYTFVNVHHFFMDNVIWRRDSPETRYLFARPPATIAGKRETARTPGDARGRQG